MHFEQQAENKPFFKKKHIPLVLVAVSGARSVFGLPDACCIQRLKKSKVDEQLIVPLVIDWLIYTKSTCGGMKCTRHGRGGLSRCVNKESCVVKEKENCLASNQGF